MNPCVQCMNFNLLNLLVNISAWLLSLLFLSLPLILSLSSLSALFLGYIYKYFIYMCFPDSSVGKESAYNAGDPGSTPGLGRSPGEGIGYPLQYSWGSLVDQLVKNPLAMRETWVQSLGWEDPLEKGKATYSSILSWRIPGIV